MQPSYEVRWFFETAPPALIEWFNQKKLNFSPGLPDRVDFYLPLSVKKGMSVKLRGDGIEIKQLIKYLGKRQYESPNIVGKYEHWIKWKFRLAKDDSLANRIINVKDCNWIEVAKDRLLFKYKFEDTKKASIVFDKDHPIPEGCQVEFTRILIQGKEYYTFGLESLSSSNHERNNFLRGAKLAFYDLTHWNATFGTTIPEVSFSFEKSMGYSEFLAKFIS